MATGRFRHLRQATKLGVMPLPVENQPSEYPASWAPHAGGLTGCVSLDVAGHATTIEVTAPQLERVYFPLLRSGALYL